MKHFGKLFIKIRNVNKIKNWKIIASYFWLTSGCYKNISHRETLNNLTSCQNSENTNWHGSKFGPSSIIFSFMEYLTQIYGNMSESSINIKTTKSQEARTKSKINRYIINYIPKISFKWPSFTFLVSLSMWRTSDSWAGEAFLKCDKLADAISELAHTYNGFRRVNMAGLVQA